MLTELYDLSVDLGETQDLSMEQPARAAELKRQLKDWLRRTGAQMPVRASGR